MKSLKIKIPFSILLVLLIMNASFAQYGELNTLFYNDIAAIDIEVQTDGKLICATTPIWGFQNNSVARLNPNGTMDDSYQNYLNSWSGNILDIDINDENYAVAVGDFGLLYGVQQRNRMARLFPNGNIDLSLPEIPVGGFLNQVLIQSDNKILFSGSFSNYDGTPCNQICRVLWNGELDSSFVENIGSGFENNATPKKMFEYPDGKILIWSSGNNFNGEIFPGGLIRLNNDGSIDSTFSVGTGPAGNSTAQEILSCDVTNEGKILLAGSFTSFNGIPTNGIVRLNADGCVDNTLIGWTDIVFTIKADPYSDKIYIVGGFDEYQGTERKNFARLHENGDLDLSFDPGGSINCCNSIQTGTVGPESIKAIAFTTNGEILLGGGIFLYDSIEPNTPGLISVWTGSNFISETIISLVGTATDQESWNADLELVSEDGIFYYSASPFFLSGSDNSLDESTKVKFRANYNWTLNWGGATFPSGTSFQNGPNIHVTASGFYNISLNRESGEYAFDFISPPPSIGLVGTAALGWDNDVIMETFDGKRYNIPWINISNGELKFRQNENWETNWGNSLFPLSCGIQNGANIPAVEGEYSVYFNRLTGNYNFEELITNVAELKQEAVSIFPNPTSGRIYINGNEIENAEYQLYAISGKIIHEDKIINKTFDISRITPGVYFLKIKLLNQESTVFKIIKN
jgi:uncharacterized delta-60 repeat protein